MVHLSIKMYIGISMSKVSQTRKSTQHAATENTMTNYSLESENKYLDNAIMKLTKPDGDNGIDWEDINLKRNEKSNQIKINERLKKRYREVKELL
jgi:hypothetical protein